MPCDAANGPTLAPSSVREFLINQRPEITPIGYGPGCFFPVRVDEFVASHVVEAVMHGIDLTQALSRARPLALPLIGWRRVRRGMLTGGCESGGQAAGTDPARGQAKVDDFWRLGRPRHANQLFWHVFGLPAG
jgi:hypothetical protein